MVRRFARRLTMARGRSEGGSGDLSGIRGLRSQRAAPLASIRATPSSDPQASTLAAVFPTPFDDVHVFRLDDERWCRATEEATVSMSYVAWQSARGVWWVRCVTDID